MMRGLRTLPFAVALFLGCASAAPRTSQKSASSSSVIAMEEIAKSGFNDAFAVVQSLRPQWLNYRGTTSFRQQATIKVYLDGNLLGTVDYLRQIPANSVSSIKHLDGMEASSRYGLDHGAGAILVYSKGRD